LPNCPQCGAATVLAFYPWNDEHPCFVGDFDLPDPFDHDFKYEDTSRGDGLYFQQSGHMECQRCGQCESADGWYDDEGY
jgi:ribosomal protein S27AE